MNYNGNEVSNFGANAPEKRFSTGAIQATVWKNKGKGLNGAPTEFRTVSFDRRYKDKEGSWQSTKSLRVSDLPKAMIVLNEAYKYSVLKDNVAITEEYAV